MEWWMWWIAYFGMGIFMSCLYAYVKARQGEEAEMVAEFTAIFLWPIVIIAMIPESVNKFFLKK